MNWWPQSSILTHCPHCTINCLVMNTDVMCCCGAQAQLLMRQDAFGGVMDFKLDGAGFGDTIVRSAEQHPCNRLGRMGTLSMAPCMPC